MIQSHTKQPTARTPGQRKNTGKKEEETMSLTITTDATEPVHTPLRNTPTGTVAIFAPRNAQPITIAKHVDDTWRSYAGDRPLTLTASDIYSRNGSFTIIHTPEW